MSDRRLGYYALGVLVGAVIGYAVAGYLRGCPCQDELAETLAFEHEHRDLLDGVIRDNED